ncbi:MAG: HAD-IA family hydrolase [Patescibacteria group bacterium]|jgi:HAD superfamily hydrolase (TIGR01509 family)
MNPPQAIIYDFDGTLVDTLPWHLEAYRNALAKFDIQASDEDIITRCFNIIDPVAAKNFGIEDADAFAAFYSEGVKDGFRKADLHHHVIETLQKLKEMDYTLCLGTLGKHVEIDIALNRFDLQQYFDIILGYDECPHPKPVIFRTIAEKVGIDPAHILVVGDASNDIDAAKKMHSRVALYHPIEHEKFYPLAQLQVLAPDFVIADHVDVFKIVEKNKETIN